MNLNGLVIGYGSIGARHARILEGIGASVSVVSRRGESDKRAVFRTLAEAQASGTFDYVILAEETARHAVTLTDLATHGHEGFVLVEKPLFAQPAALPVHRFCGAGVGYNLRFHPAVQALRKALAGHRAEMADFYVGQWLGDWRPGRDVATTYSASRIAGGGALRDLSHELDLVTWLFGPWQSVAALGGRLGNVTTDADDGWGIVLACERCPVVTVHLNSLDRQGRRGMTIQSQGSTLHADLVGGTTVINGRVERFEIERDETYRNMHRALIGGSQDICTLEEGERTVELITTIEVSARERRFITRSAA